MEDKAQSAYQEEEARLDKTLGVIDMQRARLEAVPRYTGDVFIEQVMEASREAARQQLAVAEKEPYFGRLDFQEDGHDVSALYIGKTGVQEEEGSRLLVIDWRAPAASVFYSFTGSDEKATYEAPEGVIEGTVHLKRNLVVRNRELQRMVDTYDREGGQAGLADDFLLYRLGENKDNKLRDIVSTIQAEQDRIIRAPRQLGLIIQGVAGSGKTTVALHRLAYLLYQYRDSMRAERMMILAPSRMFLDYISGVLPELGVGDIRQTTFSDWALELIGEPVALVDERDELDARFAPAGEGATPSAKGRKRAGAAEDAAAVEASGRSGLDSESAGGPVLPGRWKGSADFLKLLEACMDAYEEAYLPWGPFAAWEGKGISGDQLHTWFYEEYKHYPIAKRRERLEARMKRWVEMQVNEIGDPKRRKEMKQKAGAKLKSWLKAWEQDTVIGLYRRLFDPDRRGRLPGELLAGIPEEIARDTVKLLAKKRVTPEDLPPLLYLHDRLHGVDSAQMYDHLVVDEAQDFSPFQIALLQRHVRNNSFTILGDLSQSIHDYRGITAWHEFIDLFGEAASAYYELDRSYRSTMEIVHFAAEVLKRSGAALPLPVPVFRSGEPVAVREVEAAQEVTAIVDEIRQAQAAGAVTIAVVGRTDRDCARLNAELTEAGLELTRIEAGQQAYLGGISVVPVYLTKGLEFDAVLIAGVDGKAYTRSERDAKLLYVGCTRALHRLTLFYTGEPSPLLATAASE
ncbi:HelD family protein [Paenibacillus sp. y28]|uniref:HelD family protein n=1 Tax=Paenibacillus sp. y28 TaxID=3129110 RepID=UPI00301B0EA9